MYDPLGVLSKIPSPCPTSQKIRCNFPSVNDMYCHKAKPRRKIRQMLDSSKNFFIHFSFRPSAEVEMNIFLLCNCSLSIFLRSKMQAAKILFLPALILLVNHQFSLAYTWSIDDFLIFKKRTADMIIP